MAQCTAKCKSSQERCRRRAVTGSRVCQVHGAGSIVQERPGGRPATHARYSSIERADWTELQQKHLSDPDPLDILPELAEARTIYEDWVKRYDELVAALIAWNDVEFEEALCEERQPKPQRIPDISEIRPHLEAVTKIVQRIHAIKNQNAISRKNLLRIMTEMLRVVELEEPDEAVKKRIKDGWLGIRLA